MKQNTQQGQTTIEIKSEILEVDPEFKKMVN